ncbi:hypothetical protein LDC_3132 [sediment metagenome]|uniref:Uncharacterized protein n=1 Tax=sediment metagenome TaxID=749907 RepID=D9PNJ9_9ZZZZ
MVYNNRYHDKWHPEELTMLKDDNQLRTDKGHHDYSDGRVRVDPDEFQERCWEKLEKDGLIRTMRDKNFSEDQELFKFLYVSFNHLLEEMINNLFPGLQTRKKQISLILKHHCDVVEYKGKSCWKLRKLNCGLKQPSSFDKLLEVARNNRIPQLRYSKKRDNERGPGIPKKEMESFLLTILEQVGGICFRDDLIEIIKTIYNIQQVRRIELPNTSFDGKKLEACQDAWISVLESNQERMLLGQEHIVMAGELYKSMDPRMRRIFYMLHVQGLSSTDIAQKLSLANSTITKIVKDIGLLFIKYFSRDSDQNEILAVTQIVAHLVLRNEGNP